MEGKEIATSTNNQAETETTTTTTNSHANIHENYAFNPSLNGIASAGYPPMDRQLFKAVNTGNATLLAHLVAEDPDRLFSVTPYGNNCLHIAVMLGHDKFVKELCNQKNAFSWLLSCTNINGETPLIAALMAPNRPLASALINAYLEGNANEDLEAGNRSNAMILSVDTYGGNVLHHALRSGFEDIGIQLLDMEPRLSEQVNMSKESALFMACRKGYIEVVKKLIRIPSSVHSGPENSTAFDAAIRYANIDVVKELLNGRPELAYLKNNLGENALNAAVGYGRLEIVKILLEHDPHLAYTHNKIHGGAFAVEIIQGFLSIAKEIMRHCPDVVYTMRESDRCNALHLAISHNNTECVDYIVKTPQLHRLINQPNIDGELPLHLGSAYCMPEALRSLISHEAQDHTAVNVSGYDAVGIIIHATSLAKETLKWTEAYTLLSNAIPNNGVGLGRAKRRLTTKAEEGISSLARTYTSNTSLVAALIAFTLPGGYSYDSSDTGLPIFIRKVAFQIFLISDTIAMCTSLSVAFLCILATWENLDFLLNYRKYTRVLMWCEYGATAITFATGLFTVIAPKNLWLAVLILVITSLLPFVSKLIGEWPMVMLRIRLGRKYDPDLLATIRDAL
ncbi:hypothetical protein LUZ60_005209 [Juncus effusus]|nr:hypothetical protein LUZ60_005209 [Juncus effusus]